MQKAEQFTKTRLKTVKTVGLITTVASAAKLGFNCADGLLNVVHQMPNSFTKAIATLTGGAAIPPSSLAVGAFIGNTTGRLAGAATQTLERATIDTSQLIGRGLNRVAKVTQGKGSPVPALAPWDKVV